MPKLTRTWQNHRTFFSPDETDEYLKSLKVCVLNRKENKRCSKTTYQCSAVKKFGCKYQVQIVCPHDNLEHQVSESGEHVHPESAEMSARQVVREQALRNKSANDVRDALSEKQLPIADDGALYNMMYQDRVKDSCVTLTVGDLVTYCEDHGIDTATDVHTPFVSAFRIEDSDQVFLMMTTKHLLSLAGQSDRMQVDATYKCMWNRYPLKLCGTSDKMRRFHPYALVIASNEQTESYARMFQSLIESVALVGVNDYQPEFVLSDGAASITAALTEVFPNAARLTCYFHAKKNIRDNRNLLPNLEAWEEVERDIEDLHKCPCPNVFAGAVKLALQKWEQKGWTQYAQYFKRQWSDRLPNWFQGAALSHPSTNNGLESKNGEIKKEHTIRKALPLGIFLDRAESTLRKWSVRSLETGFKQQPDSRKEEFVRDMTAGSQFSQDRTRVITSRPDIATVPDSRMYFVETKDCCCSVEAYVAPIFQGPGIFASFDGYHRWLRSYYIVENARGWWFCTCPVGLRDYICKHTIGIQARFHGLEIPARCRSIPLGQDRGPGRPKKVAAALVRD